MLSTNDLDSPKFFRREALNFVQVIGATFPPYRRLNCVHRTLMFPQRKEAAKGVRLIPVAQEVSK